MRGRHVLLKSDRAFRSIAVVIIISLFLNLAGLDFASILLSHNAGIDSAQAAVADVDGLGSESYWNYASEGIGDGWEYLVNTNTGNLVIQKDLLSIPGRGISLGEGLTYNSLSSQTGVLGASWKLANDQFVQENADASVTLKDADATNLRFIKNPDNSYKAPDGVYLTLTKINSTTFTVKDPDNTVTRLENGYPVSITDEKGSITAFAYDASNRLLSMTDLSSRTITYSYTSGKLSSITDSASRTVSFSYNANGKLDRVTDQANVTTGFGYNAAGKLSSITDANNHTTSFFYNAESKVSRIDDARSNQSNQYSTSFSYNTGQRITTMTDPAQNSVFYTHNLNGNVTRIEDDEGVALDLTWDKNNLVRTEDANGSSSTSYDANGNVTSTTETISPTENAVTSATYDSSNNPISIVDANGYQDSLSYDSESNLLSSYNQDRKEADANTYDAYGNITAGTDPGAPSSNLFKNGNFEILVDGFPQYWYKGSNPSAVIMSTTAKYANRSVKITSQTSTTASFYSKTVPVTVGQKLTLSIAAKLDQVVGNGGARIALRYKDTNGDTVRTDYSDYYKCANQGSTDIVLTSEVPTNAVNVIGYFYLWDASGSIWFDGAQLESPIDSSEGHIRTAFDYVIDSSIEYTNHYWSTAGGAGGASYNDVYPWSGNKCIKIYHGSTATSWAESTNTPVKAGEKLTLSGIIKTDNLIGDGARVEIRYFDSSNNLIGSEFTPYQTGTKEYTRYAVAVTPPAGTLYARVYAYVQSSRGKAYFDNMKLTPRATTSYEYDTNGNYLAAVTDPPGNRFEYGYDSAGNCTSFKDAKNKTTSYAYDSLGNLTSVTDPYNKVSRYGYDGTSMQTSYRDARSASAQDNTYKTTFVYNQLNQLIGATDPLGRETAQSYDDAGNLSSIGFPNNKSVNFSYDSANRLSQKTYSSSSTAYTYTYDSAGNLSQVQDNSARNYGFSYDKANRLKSLTNIFNYRLDFGLDDAGNITSIADSNDKTVNYAYGSDGKLLTITDPSGGQTKFRYGENGVPFEIVKGNGKKRTILYDQAGNIKEIADNGNSNSPRLSYGYDSNSNIASVASSGSGGTELFTYDYSNRLLSWTDESGAETTYEYDAVGNLTKKGGRNFTYNAANQIANSGFTYDANGNLTSDGTFNYSYDNENHLTSVTRVSDGSTVATYEYDYRGLRISKTTATGTVYYHWDDQDRLVRESNPAGATLALYVYDDRNNLITIEKGGQAYYTHTNHRGDILAVTDSSGNQVAAYKYGPWGELLEQTGTFEQPFRYAGYYYDAETGLYDLKARYYSSDLGRFLTKDSFAGLNEETLSLNLYVYCEDNPMVNIDPDGHSPVIAALRVLV